MIAGGLEGGKGMNEEATSPKCDDPSSGVLVQPGGCRYMVTKMYHLCLLEPALFRFLHDAPRSGLLIDLPPIFFMTL